MSIDYFDSYLEDEDNGLKRTILMEGPCQNNCAFCFAKDKRTKDWGFTFSEIKDIITNGKKKGNKILHFSGYCEPGLYPELLKAIKYAREIGYKHICITTNGHVFADKSYFENLVKAGLSQFLLSFHTHLKDVGKEIYCSDKAVDDSIEALKNAVSLKKKYSLSISCLIVLTSLNIKELPELVEYLSDYRVDSISISLADPIGNAQNNYSRLSLSKKELLHYLNLANAKLKKLKQKVQIKLPINLLSYLKNYDFSYISVKFDENNPTFSIFDYCDILKEGKIYNGLSKQCLDCSMSYFCFNLKPFSDNLKKNNFTRAVITDLQGKNADIVERLQKFSASKESFDLQIPLHLTSSYIDDALISKKLRSFILDCTDYIIEFNSLEKLKTCCLDKEFILDKYMIENVKVLLKFANIVNGKISLRIFLSKDNIYELKDLAILFADVRNKDGIKVIFSQRQKYLYNKDYLISMQENSKLLEKVIDLLFSLGINTELSDIPFCYFSDNYLEKHTGFNFVFNNFYPSFINLTDKKIDYQKAYKIIVQSLRYKKNKCSSCKLSDRCQGELRDVIKYLGFNPKPILNN